jgi:putative membrane protein
MMWDDGGGGWWWVWMAIWGVVFWALVIAGIFALVNWLGSGRNDHRGESPEETLRRRLASGEIDEVRYRALLDELNGRSQGPGVPAH